MTTQQEIVRQSDLLNQIVVDRDTLEELGRVEVLWMYPPVHRVLGFICKTGFLGSKKLAFKLAQIDAIGDSGILTHSAPDVTDAERVSKLESLVQSEIWSNDGTKIGKITDCLFDLQTGTITHYLFVASSWASMTGEVYQLPPQQIASFGKKRVLVSGTNHADFELYREGLRQKLTETTEILKEEAAQEWRSLTQKAEQASEKTKEHLQGLTEQTREQTQRFSQLAKEQVKTLNQQLGESQSWLEHWQEKGQTVAERLSRKTQRLSRQVEEGIETIIVQAEEIFESGFDVRSPEAKKSSQQASSTAPPADIPEVDRPQNQPVEEPWDDIAADTPEVDRPQSKPVEELWDDIEDDDDDEPWI